MDRYSIINDLQDLFIAQNKWLVTAESCTGGLISHLITEVPGSSGYFLGGVVCYANEIKQNIVGVHASTIETFGAVSQQTVEEMASGIRSRFANPMQPVNDIVSIAVTGVAGPGGGTADKPVGLVWIGINSQQGKLARQFIWQGNRQENSPLRVADFPEPEEPDVFSFT